MLPSGRSAVLRYAAPAIGVAAVLVSLMAVRLERDASSYLRAGDEFYRRGKTAEAYFAWKLSISMYVPFSPTPRKAANRLWEAGEEGLRKGNPGESLRALGYLRSGLLAVRHVLQPMPDLLARTEDRMATLLPRENSGGRTRLLEVRHGTSPAGYPFLVIGGLGWPLSVALLLRRWRSGGAVWHPKSLLPPALFLALLIAGVWIS